MTETDRDLDERAAAAGAQLRNAELDVPAAVAQRLQAARRQAVAAAEEEAGRRSNLRRRTVGTGAAFAAVLVVAIAATLMVQAPIDTLPIMDDTEFAAAQDVDLLEELEFVAWMIAMEEANDLPNSG